MKANELMVGDWVEYRFTGWTEKDGVYEDYQYVQISTIGELYVKADNDRVASADGKEFFPIPLTPEILEKNGFVENRGATSWKFETEREDLIDIYGYNEYHLSINIEDTHGSGKGYRWMLNNLVIFYVHQLQHAFRLCGIDKEIEL